jgi:hypothetical protein
MADIHDLFIEIGNFKKLLPKAMRGHRDKNYFRAQTQASLTKIGGLLNDPEVTNILDQLLKIVQDQINKPHALESAQETVKTHTATFLKAENSLHTLTGLKGQDYEQVVDLIGHLLPTTDLSEFPKTARELREHFQKTANDLLEAIEESIQLPRQQKDRFRAAIDAQHWRYTVATIMTLGNVAGFLLTLPLSLYAQIGGGTMGVASCRYGVALFKISQSTRETHQPKRAKSVKNSEEPRKKAKGIGTNT